jgi:hypothetical protein
MSARLLRRSALIAGLLALGIFTSRETYAATGDTLDEPTAPTGFGTITVEQISPTETLGLWTLLQPGNQKYVGKEAVKLLEKVPAGSHTIIVTPPEGAVTTLRLYRGSEEIKLLERQQMTFPVADGDVFKLVISYTFTLVGNISVQSDPNGLTFAITGPNDFKAAGTTPMSYENMPEGQYKVQFDKLEGCVLPAPKALQLEKNKRVSFDLKLVCDAADKMREIKEEVGEKFVTPTVEGKEILFRDVPQDAWFADAVFNAAKRGVLLGYKDAKGNFTGEFGPGNNVNIAELAKIAHKLAGLEEGQRSEGPRNIDAQGQWYSSFIASAEEKGWTIYVDGTIDPNRPATRGEVMVTLLQALNTPMQWQKGALFTDVTTRTAYAAAIETSATLGIVEGRKDASGKLTGIFSPADPVNRAEMAKIVNAAMTIILKVK